MRVEWGDRQKGTSECRVGDCCTGFLGLEDDAQPPTVLENDPLRQNYFHAHFRDINGMKNLYFVCRLSLYRVLPASYCILKDL